MNPLLPALAAAVKAIQARSPLRPSVGLVLGSGLGGFAQSLEKPAVIPYREIPEFPTSTAIGHKGELVLGTSGGRPLVWLQRRTFPCQLASP